MKIRDSVEPNSGRKNALRFFEIFSFSGENEKIDFIFRNIIYSIMSKSKLGKAVSDAISNSLLSTLPPQFAEKFSVDEQEVKDFLTNYLNTLTGPVKTKRSTGPNGYVAFSSANRKAIQDDLAASGKLEGLTKKEAFGVVGKEVGARWKVLSEGEKDDWNVKAKNKAAAPPQEGTKAVTPAVAAVAVKKTVKKTVPKATEAATVVPVKKRKVRKAGAKESDDEASQN